MKNKDERIRRSIDEIEPAEGARERMLANISRKAAEQTAPEDTKSKPGTVKVLPFKRIMKWAMPIAACFVIAVIGVTVMNNTIKTTEPFGTEDNVQIANPFAGVDNAAEFERVLGISIDAPKGAENVEYSIVDNEMADIVFDFEGHCYNIRASKAGGDFSGLNGIEEKTEQIDAKHNAMLTVIRSGDEFYLKITWTDGQTTFILSNTDGASEDELKAVYERVK
ncbi:MAG: hypothetical protein K5695_12485 [Oscillospiraceae bacterium]|nr:hypothetical protein [Oscillospiraceae bacterium]